MEKGRLKKAESSSDNIDGDGDSVCSSDSEHVLSVADLRMVFVVIHAEHVVHSAWILF